MLLLTLGLRSFLEGLLSFRNLLLRLASHLEERIDQVIDRLMSFRLAPHPDQRVEEVINRFILFRHAAC